MDKMMFCGALYGYNEGEAMKIRVETIKDIADAYTSHSTIIQNKVNHIRVVRVDELRKRLCDAVQEDNWNDFNIKIITLIDELSPSNDNGKHDN
jgi:hypothetical protein